MLLEDTPAILSLGKLCADHGNNFHRTTGQKPHHIKKGQEDQLQHCELRTLCCPCSIDKFFKFIFTHFSYIFIAGNRNFPRIPHQQEVSVWVKKYQEACRMDQHKPKTFKKWWHRGRTRRLVASAETEHPWKWWQRRNMGDPLRDLPEWLEDFTENSVDESQTPRRFQFSWITFSPASKIGQAHLFYLTSRRTDIAVSARETGNVNSIKLNRDVSSALNAHFRAGKVEEQPNKKPKKSGRQNCSCICEKCTTVEFVYHRTLSRQILQRFRGRAKRVLELNSTSTIHKGRIASSKHPRKERSVARENSSQTSSSAQSLRSENWGQISSWDCMTRAMRPRRCVETCHENLYAQKGRQSYSSIHLLRSGLYGPHPQ